MDNASDPFIPSSEGSRDRSRPKDYKPLSIRSWFLLLYLAATAGCFGLLMTISLMERKTNLAAKTYSKRSTHVEDLIPRALEPSSESQYTTYTTVPTATTEDLLNLGQTPTRNPRTTRIVSTTSDNHRDQKEASTTTDVATTDNVLNLKKPPTTTTTAQATTSRPPVYSTATNLIALNKGPTTSTRTSKTIAELSTSSFPPSTTLCYVTITATIVLYTSPGGGTSTSAVPITAAPAGSCSSLTVTVIRTSLLSLYSPTTTIAAKVIPSTPSQSTSSAQVIAQVGFSTVDRTTAGAQSTSQPYMAIGTTTTDAAFAVQPMITRPSTTTTAIYVFSSSVSGQVLITSVPTLQNQRFTSSTARYITTQDSDVVRSTTSWYGTPLAFGVTPYTSGLVIPQLVTASGNVVYAGVPSSVATFSSQTSLTTESRSGYESATPIGAMLQLTPNSQPSSTISIGSGAWPFLLVPATGTNTYTFFELDSQRTTSTYALSSGSVSGMTVIKASSTTTWSDQEDRTMPTTTNMLSTRSPTATATAGRNSTVDPNLSQNLVLVKDHFQMYDYFLAIYLPKIIAVIMSAVWGILLASFKLMEPFYQLSARNGAFAKHTFFGNYLSSDINPSSVSSSIHGQWVLILGSLILVVWASIVALISEFSLVISLSDCTGEDGHIFRCDPGWVVNRTVLYGLMVLVAVNLVLISVLALVMLQRKRTGIHADPSSIASMNELLGNRYVMDDLRMIDANDTERDIKIKLGDNRYKLGWYNLQTGHRLPHYVAETSEDRWGLIKLMDSVEPRSQPVKREVYTQLPGSSPENVGKERAHQRQRIFRTVFQTVMLLTSICIFILVLVYWFSGGSNPLNDFLNQQNFGPRFVMTGLALILSMGWRRTCQDITLLAPYRSMARFDSQRGDTTMYRDRIAGVKADHSVLATTACTPYTAFSRALKLRNYTIALAALCAMLGDILLIAISGVPFNPGQTIESLTASTMISLAILGIMVVATGFVIIYNSRSAGGTRKLPRSPDSLIGVWLYLCGSRLTLHAKPDNDEPVVLDGEGLKVKYGHGRYGFAKARGVDGAERWTVDILGNLHLDQRDMAQHSPDIQRAPQQTRQPSRTSSQYSFQPSIVRVEANQAAEVQLLRGSTRRKPVPQSSTTPAEAIQETSYGDGYASSDHVTRGNSVQKPHRRFESLRYASIPEEADIATDYDTTERLQGTAKMNGGHREVTESERLMGRLPSFSVHTRSNGVWMGSHEYRRYGT